MRELIHFKYVHFSILYNSKLKEVKKSINSKCRNY